MKQSLMRTLALAAALGASATAPLAAQEAGTIFLGGFAQETRFDEQTGLTSDWASGVNGLLGVFVVPNLALELTYGRSWTEDATPAGVDGTWNPLRGRLVWNIPASHSFYPLLGVGAVRNDYKGAGIDDIDVGISGLAGFKAYLTRRLAVRADVSLDHMPSPFNDGATVGTTTVESHQNWTVSAGLTYDLTRGRSWDSDGDGVVDRLDACPDTPRGVRVDAVGCRVDSDGDGVFDEDDACPNTPAGVRVDSRGCRVDSDGDGVYDEDDRCPNTPAGTQVDQSGCPIPPPAPPPAPAAPPAPALVLDGVHFGFDSAELSADARATLDRVAESLVGNPNVRVRVVGHTDISGDATYNVRLSERRAQSVAEYLTSRGVAANRLETVGRGPAEPAASNDTRAGREQNRRVELARIN